MSSVPSWGRQTGRPAWPRLRTPTRPPVAGTSRPCKAPGNNSFVHAHAQGTTICTRAGKSLVNQGSLTTAYTSVLEAAPLLQIRPQSDGRRCTAHIKRNSEDWRGFAARSEQLFCSWAAEKAGTREQLSSGIVQGTTLCPGNDSFVIAQGWELAKESFADGFGSFSYEKHSLRTLSPQVPEQKSRSLPWPA